jgi:hypothetical protein
MQDKNKLLIALLALVLYVPMTYAQSDIITTGGNASSADGSTNYSMGQVNYITVISTSGASVSQGVQQAYEISSIVGLDDISIDPLELMVYPNPTTDYLTLKGESTMDQELTYTLCDASGRVLQTLSITDDVTSIQMTNYAPATYFLNISKSGTAIKTFKIIKKH